MHDIQSSLTELEKYRERSALLFYGPIDYQTSSMIYECIRHFQTRESLDLILISSGGLVNEARNVALLLREHFKEVDILIPSFAKSAGTILSLCADHLYMSSLSQLSPIDGQILGGGQSGLPPVISAEDIRAFYKMADEWFKLATEDIRVQLFGILSQRIFPATLGSIYRADKLVKDIGIELISYQLKEEELEIKTCIINNLMTKFHSHEYGISRSQAMELGLRVLLPDLKLEELMQRINESCRITVERNHNDGKLINNFIITSSVILSQDSTISPDGHINFSNRKSWKKISDSESNS